MSLNTNIKELEEKYWQGETSLEEERLLFEHFESGDLDELTSAYLHFIQNERQVQYTPSSSNIKKMYWPKMIGLAASVLLVSSVFITTYYGNSDKNEVFVAQNPEQALQITQNTLSYINSKINKGNVMVFSHLNEYNKINIIN